MKDEDVFLMRCAFYKIKKYKNEKKLMKLINKRFSKQGLTVPYLINRWLNHLS